MELPGVRKTLKEWEALHTPSAGHTERQLQLAGPHDPKPLLKADTYKTDLRTTQSLPFHLQPQLLQRVGCGWLPAAFPLLSSPWEKMKWNISCVDKDREITHQLLSHTKKTWFEENYFNRCQLEQSWMITKRKPPSSSISLLFILKLNFSPSIPTPVPPSHQAVQETWGTQGCSQSITPVHNTSSVLLLALHFFFPPMWVLPLGCCPSQAAPAWLLLRLKFLSGKPILESTRLHVLQLPTGNTSTVGFSTGYSVDNCSSTLPLLRMEGIAAPPRASPQAAGTSPLKQLQHLLSPCSLELALSSSPQAPLTAAASRCQHLEFSRAHWLVFKHTESNYRKQNCLRLPQLFRTEESSDVRQKNKTHPKHPELLKNWHLSQDLSRVSACFLSFSILATS